MAAMTEALRKSIDESIAQSDSAAPEGARQYRARVADYAIILKPRVMSLVVFVGLVGLLLAPGAIAPEVWRAAFGTLLGPSLHAALASGGGTGGAAVGGSPPCPPRPAPQPR